MESLMTVWSLMLYITAACVVFVLGYWTWYDRRYYGFGIMASLVWAIGIMALCGVLFALMLLITRVLR